MNPEEIARKEFPVVMRGYVREEVLAFLATLASELAERDARIATLEKELAQSRERAAEVDRGTLLRQLGEEAASILACADASAERLKAQGELATRRVRQDLRGIGSSLTDVHQLLGELVSLVQGLTEESPLARPGDVTPMGSSAPPPAQPDSEVRTVLGEVLGLDDGSASQEIHLPAEGQIPSN